MPKVIKTAVEGTLNVLRACTAASVKRVVVTSSIGVLFYTSKETAPLPGQLLNESYWSDHNDKSITTYEYSKILSEKEAWAYHQSLPAENRFDLVYLLPSFICGPPLSTAYYSSGAMFNLFVQGRWVPK